jgi:tetratricopeptide (TPR) repeat protein
LFNSRNSFSTLKYAAASYAILSIISFSAVGQTSAENSTHPSTIKKLEARDELNKGYKEYKKARYDEAIRHFQRATELDPGLIIAKAYLGTAREQYVVPGLDTPDNLKIAQHTIEIFQQVLDANPHDVNSMKQVAGVYYSVNKLDDAKAWQKKVLAEDPKDPEAAYTVGVIDWQEAHQNVLDALTPAGMNDDGEGNTKAPAVLMEKIKAQNSALIEEGLAYLNRAVENRPNYGDAMAYVNLMYRRKADVDFGAEEARKDDVAKADEWRNKAIEAYKADEEKKNAGHDSPQQ